MTAVYFPGSNGSIFVGQTGHPHVRSTPADDNTPTAIDCRECEPFLIKLGGTYNKTQVPLTDRQEAARERMKEEGNAAVSEAAKALASTATASMRRHADDDEFERRVEAGVKAALERGAIVTRLDA